MVVTPGQQDGVHRSTADGVRPLDTASNTARCGDPACPRARAGSRSRRTAGRCSSPASRANTVTPIATATNQPGAPIGRERRRRISRSRRTGGRRTSLTAGNTLTPIDLATTDTCGPRSRSRTRRRRSTITPDGALAVVSENEGDAGFVQVIDLASGTPEPPVSLSAQPGGRRRDRAGRAHRVRRRRSDPDRGPFTRPPRTAGSIPFTIATRTRRREARRDGYFYAIDQARRRRRRRPPVRRRTRAPAAGVCVYGYVFDLRLSEPDRIGVLFDDGTRGRRVSSRATMVLAPEPGGLVHRHGRDDEPADDLRRRRLQQRRRLDHQLRAGTSVTATIETHERGERDHMSIAPRARTRSS